MTLKYLALAAFIAVTPAAYAQDAGNAEPEIKPTQPAPGAPETSDRTPGKETKTPQNQMDTSGGKTSDRSGSRDLTVDHQPGAAGTAGSATSSGSAGSGSNTMKPADTPASGDQQ